MEHDRIYKLEIKTNHSKRFMNLCIEKIPLNYNIFDDKYYRFFFTRGIHIKELYTNLQESYRAQPPLLRNE